MINDRLVHEVDSRIQEVHPEKQKQMFAISIVPPKSTTMREMMQQLVLKAWMERQKERDQPYY